MVTSYCKGIKRVTADRPVDYGEEEWNWTANDVINVAPGEDIKRKIISFAENRQLISIGRCYGSVSSANIKRFRSAESSTYQGEFSIGALMGMCRSDPPGPTTNNLTVKLVGIDGQIIQGYVEDFLIAATEVQVSVYIYEFF